MKLIRDQGFSLVETLIAIFIVVVVTLGGSSLLVQAHRTSNKSKVVMQGLQMETDLIELASNGNAWATCSPPSATQSCVQRLRSNNPPDSFRLKKAGMAQPPMVAEDLLIDIPYSENGSRFSTTYYNAIGKKVLSTDTWTVQVFLSYRRTWQEVGSTLGRPPEYSIAYNISYNPALTGKSTGPIRELGLKTGGSAFQATDYILPLATSNYASEFSQPTQGNGDINQCGVIGQNFLYAQVLGVTSFDFTNGRANCVLLNNDQISDPGSAPLSVGITLEDSGENKEYRLKTKTRTKCGCGHIAPENWVVAEVNPSALYFGAPGASCGTCEFAFKKEVDARTTEIASEPGRTVYAACPSQHYRKSSFQCEALLEVNGGDTNTCGTNPCENLTGAALTTCQGQPTFQNFNQCLAACSDLQSLPSQPPIEVSDVAGGRVSCTLSGVDAQGSNSCGSWSYTVRAKSSPTPKCELFGKDPQPAKLVGL